MSSSKTHTVMRALKAYISNRPYFLGLIRAKEIELYARYMPFKQPILDVGCGDGFFAHSLFSQPQAGNSRIDLGIDLKGSRMDEAESTNIYKAIQIFDGVHINKKDNYFTTVISNCVFEHVDDIEGLLDEIYRVTAPGGVLYTTVVSDKWEEYLLGSVLFGDRYKQWMRKKQEHARMWSHRQWKKVFKKAGFTVLESIGYLDRSAVSYVDVAHYLSFPSLIWRALFGKWTVSAACAKLHPLRLYARVIQDDLSVKQGGNIFYVLSKPKKA